VGPDNAWLRRLDEEYPYQIVLPRRQLSDDSEIMNFLIKHAGKFDMYVEDDYAPRSCATASRIRSRRRSSGRNLNRRTIGSSLRAKRQYNRPFCKPLVGSSIPSPGTSNNNHLT
jgi:hypothetical protein